MRRTSSRTCHHVGRRSSGRPHSRERNHEQSRTQYLEGLEGSHRLREGRASLGTYRVHIPPAINVKAIRTKLGMSQQIFAERFGFRSTRSVTGSKETVNRRTCARLSPGHRLGARSRPEGARHHRTASKIQALGNPDFQGLDFFTLWVSLGRVGYLLLLAGKVWAKSHADQRPDT